MKRILYTYTLLALAITSGAPAETVEDFPVESSDEATEVSSSSPDRRAAGEHRVAGSAQVEHRDSGITDVTGFEAIDARWRNVIAARLLEAALAGCRNEGTLKVRIDMPLPLESVTTLCGKCRFNYWRTVTRHGRTVHEFYADLYTGPDDPACG